ncbi:MAG TPA: response regulator transcription factor [Pseudogracilibacillus sp.]|nr:response regulator transcription factor [Pseudogracilibacillus sp.]
MDRKILIVEDEPAIVTLIRFNLEKAGFQTDVSYDGEEAIARLQEETYDLIVLDVMLPKMDGMEVCKKIRQDDNFVPILMLTAKDSEYDKIYGLEMGADDYLTKPFSPKELIARIQAILRRTDRSKTYEDENLKIGDLVISPKRFEAHFKGELLELTRKEFELIAYLTAHKGQILSREQLLSAVWGYDFVGDTRIVDVQVSNLREKIELDTKKPQYIKTVRGFGYKMEEVE